MIAFRDTWLILLLVAACGPTRPHVGTGTGEATGADTTATASSASATSAASVTSTSSSASTTSTTSTSGDGSDSTGPDFPPPMTCAELNNYPAEQCDVEWAERNGQACNAWVDDCGPGAACRYYVDILPHCVPLPARPKPAFAPCEPEAFDCDKGLFCVGQCIPLCSCHPLRPHCDDPNSICTGYGDPERPPGVCYEQCDVLEPACPDSLPSCRPYADGPVCVFELPSLAAIGEPCALANVGCAAGLACTEGAPLCDDGACCSPLCPLDDPGACTELGPEYACSELTAPYEPLCYANVGICRRR